MIHNGNERFQSYASFAELFMAIFVGGTRVFRVVQVDCT